MTVQVSISPPASLEYSKPVPLARSLTGLKKMAVERQVASSSTRQRIGGLFKRVNSLIRAIAQPCLTQLVLRFGLAVPFWRSGVNKWSGFLQLNDVAVLLFSTEFKLHLPGGPYDFPAPGVMAFIVGSAEILLPILLILGLATRLSAL